MHVSTPRNVTVNVKEGKARGRAVLHFTCSTEEVETGAMNWKTWVMLQGSRISPLRDTLVCWYQQRMEARLQESLVPR